MQLAITRSHDQLHHLQKLAKVRGIKVVAIPLTKTQEIAFDWPAAIFSGKVDWLAFTSGTAIDVFYRRLIQLGLRFPDGVRIAVLGQRTAEHLNQYSIDFDFIASQPGAQILFEELCDEYLRSGQTVVHPRAEKVATEPERILRAKGVHYVPVVCYRMIPSQINTATVQSLTSNDFILFTSPSAINVYHDTFGRPVARPIAIGQTTADRMSRLGWSGFITMKEANINSILEYLL